MPAVISIVTVLSMLNALEFWTFPILLELNVLNAKLMTVKTVSSKTDVNNVLKTTKKPTLLETNVTPVLLKTVTSAQMMTSVSNVLPDLRLPKKVKNALKSLSLNVWL